MNNEIPFVTSPFVTGLLIERTVYPYDMKKITLNCLIDSLEVGQKFYYDGIFWDIKSVYITTEGKK